MCVPQQLKGSAASNSQIHQVPHPFLPTHQLTVVLMWAQYLFCARMKRPYKYGMDHNRCLPSFLNLRSLWILYIDLNSFRLFQSAQQYQPPRPAVPEAPAPPNNILFVQNLPHDATSEAIQALFQQFPGFKEVRMIEAKPGIAFVEYGDEMQATVAHQGLQNFRVSPSHAMQISYAKK